mgnify:CR=1 FL=1
MAVRAGPLGAQLVNSVKRALLPRSFTLSTVCVLATLIQGFFSSQGYRVLRSVRPAVPVRRSAARPDAALPA